MNRRPLKLCAAILLGLVFVIALATACSLQTTDRDAQSIVIQKPCPATVISPTQIVWEMLGQVNRDRALSDLRRLAGDAPVCAGTDCYTIANRLTGSEGLHRATDYVFNSLVSLGYSVSFQNWSLSGHSDRNVIARKPGAYAPAEEVYFVAHLDGVSSSAAERFPAADDDASGVADILELARILSSHTFSRTMVLLFTTGEEQGELGARSYLDHLSPSELGSIKYAVDVDAVGHDANRDGVMELWHGGHAPSMAVTQLMSETIRTYQLDLTPRLIAARAGDDGPFRAAGIATGTQVEDFQGEPNRYYHNPEDTIDNMNLDYWLEQIRATMAIAADLAVPIPSTITTCLPVSKP
jgi:hypothetical protein